MPDNDALLGALEWLAAALSDSFVASDQLQTLVEQVGDVVGVTGAGVLLLQRGRFSYATSTLEPIAALERVVEEFQYGPCVDASKTRQPVAVRDLRAGDYPQRFPAYVEQAQRSQITAVAAVPMQAGEHSLGALGLYDREPRDWSEEDLRVAGVLADIASAYLLHTARDDDRQRLCDQLQQALDSRIVIEQAKGIVAVERGIGVDQAFALLRKQARDTNRRLHDVCAEVTSLHGG